MPNILPFEGEDWCCGIPVLLLIVKIYFLLKNIFVAIGHQSWLLCFWRCLHIIMICSSLWKRICELSQVMHLRRYLLCFHQNLFFCWKNHFVVEKICGCRHKNVFFVLHFFREQWDIDQFFLWSVYFNERELESWYISCRIEIIADIFSESNDWFQPFCDDGSRYHDDVDKDP